MALKIWNFLCPPLFEQRIARGNRYTAIELGAFAVFAVTVVVLAIQVVRPYIARGRLNRAVGTIAGELRFARIHALSSKKFTAVLMPTAQDDNFGGFTDPQYKAASLRVCTLAEPPTADLDLKNWKGSFEAYIADHKSWIFLPKRIYIGYTETHGEYAQNSSANRCNVVNNIAFPEANNTTAVHNVRAVIFSPEGAAIGAPQGGTPGTGDIQIKVLPAIIKEKYQLWPLSEGNAVSIIVNRLSGKLSFIK